MKNLILRAYARYVENKTKDMLRQLSDRDLADIGWRREDIEHYKSA